LIISEIDIANHLNMLRNHLIFLLSLITLSVTGLTQSAWAQSVSLSGNMGANKALLMIDGSPYTVNVGSTVQGVRLISVNANEAVVEVGGKRANVRLGAGQAHWDAGRNDIDQNRIVMATGAGGHFFSSGTINGKTVEFLVDTGASVISIGQAQADRIGLKYRSSPRTMTNTANGPVATHSVSLATVRIGNVQLYEVQALVVPADMPYVLLGNSFLNRFEMKIDNQTLTLDKRY
jgi:aspartyl protease family protein